MLYITLMNVTCHNIKYFCLKLKNRHLLDKLYATCHNIMPSYLTFSYYIYIRYLDTRLYVVY
jgi:hypothetical protein